MKIPFWFADDLCGFEEVNVKDDFDYHGRRLKVVRLEPKKDGSFWPWAHCSPADGTKHPYKFHAELVATLLHLQRNAEAAERVRRSGRLEALMKEP